LLERFAQFRIIAERYLWIVEDLVEMRCLQFPDPQQIELCLRNLTGKFSDDLPTATLKRCCQCLDVLAEGWIGSNRDCQAVAKRKFGSARGISKTVAALLQSTAAWVAVSFRRTAKGRLV
jgi:hypothetical protein